MVETYFKIKDLLKSNEQKEILERIARRDEERYQWKLNSKKEKVSFYLQKLIEKRLVRKFFIAHIMDAIRRATSLYELSQIESFLTDEEIYKLRKEVRK